MWEFRLVVTQGKETFTHIVKREDLTASSPRPLGEGQGMRAISESC